MNQELKAQTYGNLLNKHRMISNQISDIKSENFELNQEQVQKVRILESKQVEIMTKIRQLFE
jgi:hypothetical protein